MSLIFLEIVLAKFVSCKPKGLAQFANDHNQTILAWISTVSHFTIQLFTWQHMIFYVDDIVKH